MNVKHQSAPSEYFNACHTGSWTSNTETARAGWSMMSSWEGIYVIQTREDEEVGYCVSRRHFKFFEAIVSKVKRSWQIRRGHRTKTFSPVSDTMIGQWDNVSCWFNVEHITRLSTSDSRQPCNITSDQEYQSETNLQWVVYTLSICSRKDSQCTQL